MLCFSHPEDGSGRRAELAEPGVGTETAAVRRDQGRRPGRPRRRRLQPAAATPAATPQADGAQAAGPTPSLVAGTGSAEERLQGRQGCAAAAATATANARPGFQRADLNASSAPPASGDQPAAGGVDEATPAATGDALLVNGSVSNGVERRAIGNFRKGPGSGYRGDVSSIVDNSALDARNLLAHGPGHSRSRLTITCASGSRSAGR